MDNSADIHVKFDVDGVCSYCHEYLEKFKLLKCHDGKQGSSKKFDYIVDKLKKAGRGKKYDCLIGLSGGVDSTYVAYLLVKNGIRPLALHLDNGWNSELSVKNIQIVVDKLNIPLITYIIDWEEFKDIQLSFLKASLSNIEAPTDHAINASLFKFSVKYQIKYIVSGGNIATESILPKYWGSDGRDLKHILSIHKKFGKMPLKTFPTMSLLNSIDYLFLKRKRLIFLLNHIDYNKENAIRELEKNLGWKNYPGKHFESIFTRFFQAYILPKKFNLDKRRSHYSSLINSNQLSREKALNDMNNSPYLDQNLLKQDFEYVIKKLGLSKEEFTKIMDNPPADYLDYPNNAWLFREPRIIKFMKILLTKL